MRVDRLLDEKSEALLELSQCCISTGALINLTAGPLGFLQLEEMDFRPEGG